MQPDMLGQTLQLEHMRRVHELEVAAALRTRDGGQDADSVPRPESVARLLAMRLRHHHRSVGADADAPLPG